MALGRVILTALALSWLACATAVAADDVARFSLYADCGPMGLLVTIDGADGAADIGLTEDAVQAAAESRLRAGRLYLAEIEPIPFLHVQIHVVSPAFSVRLDFRKIVQDPLSGEWHYAETWWTGSLGTHGGEYGYILSSLSLALDNFIADYLRVNESACLP